MSLEYNSNDLISEVTVRNYAGQIISLHKNIHQNKLELDLSNLAEGIYLAEIKTSQGIYARKISVVK
ncbi:MAG: T9SS type A sorting domain-containing protein [Bacteroidetes bacterium]|nr:T9SS type A sorting domain-containing protein [Bacteroidota bacterium]